MTTNAIKLLTLLMAVLFLACSRNVHKSIQTKSESKTNLIMQQSIPSRNNHFAFHMMRQLPFEDDNFVVSPFSISTALAMTYAGARGQTQMEMASTLFFDDDQQGFHRKYGQYLTTLKELAGDHVQLNIANNLWVQQGYHFLPEYFSTIESNYGTSPAQVNFRGDTEPIRQGINDWVYSQTRERIKDLIAPGILTEDTRMVLVNAIHFLGKWMVEFNKELTRKEIFRGMDGQGKETEFMRRTGYFNYAEHHGMQAIEMLYQGGNYSMVLLLPNKTSDVVSALSTLDGFAFEQIVSAMERTHVDLRLPRFEAETSVNLERLLSEMGMPLAFSKKADFSGMTGDDSLMIDKVIHKAMIEVKESGTEAAAATAVVMIMKTSIEPEPERTVVFHADRPFLFFIKDNTYNNILFMGRMAKM